jgi:LmbE family N-acetylglucosaminyl deacetylase
VLLLFEADEPDHVEDVETFVDQKLAALHAHTSQLLSTMGIDHAADPAEVARQTAAFDEHVRARLRERGALEGIAQGESFKLIADL